MAPLSWKIAPTYLRHKWSHLDEKITFKYFRHRWSNLDEKIIPKYLEQRWTDLVKKSLLSPDQTIAISQRNTSQHCWPSICKLWPNDRNIWTQQIPTLLDATCCMRLPTLLTRCNMPLQFENRTRAHTQAQHCWHEPGQTTITSCNIHKCCMKNLTIFKFWKSNTQHIATRSNMEAKRTQQLGCTQPCCDSCIEMLLSHGRGLEISQAKMNPVGWKKSPLNILGTDGPT